MKNSRFGLQFVFRKPKGETRSLLPLYLRISAGGQRTEVSTRRSWQPDRWDTITGRAVGTREDARTLNAYLSALQARVYEVYLQLVNNHQDVTAEALKDGLSGDKKSGRTLVPIFQRHNEQLAKLVGAEFASATLSRYQTALDHTVAFLRSRYQTDDISIDKLDYEFVTEYEFWLKSARKCGHNTAVKYISNLRKVVNICLKNGWLARDPFLGYKMTKREVVRAVLTQNEVDVLTKKEFAIERLAIVRDLFLFSCYTGLAYADIKKLKRSEVAIGIDGEKWIFTSRQKTDTASRIPLLPQAMTIIERYADNPICANKDTLLPVPSNQKMNAYLKEIADVCGILKPMTCHTARHTFATTITLTNGVPIETVSKMLGHRSLKTTQLYAKILDTKVSDDMLKLRSKLTS
ncbi:site-specific integrase [Dawidia soli]|uniref:Site-specific integrase n=1 Tax=Dawidia soli TaxID=2782352 RepID=A0AAP2GKA4_9BACT|nr:site-specific integrase [Dawidia soli]MBT1689420.1 site-specific integrase [Dawidia soli]